MPRLKYVIHPSYGRLPVNATRPCPSCGAHGSPCYFMCAHSPAWQSADEERVEALATEQAIDAVGFQAWDSAQHRAHGLPCPYDGYDPADEYHAEGDWPLVPLADGTPAQTYVIVETPPARKCEFSCENDATAYGGYHGAGSWAGYVCDEHSTIPGFAVWDRVGSPTLPVGQDDVPF